MATTTSMTGAQFDALPYEEGRRWELVEGELIEVPSATPEHQIIVGKLIMSLGEYFRQSPIGGVLPDVEFALSDRDRMRPDVCVLLGERWTGLNRKRIPIPGAPDIACEIISPSERTAESTRKVRTYLRRGVKEVWQVFPEAREVIVWTADAMTRVLDAGEALSTGALPGWTLPLSGMFEP
jgi:Uma2 family endonuclease